MLRWLIYPALLLLGVVYFFWAHAKVLGHPLRCNDDVVQHFLWLFDGPWADDFYAQTSGVIQPWGYKAVLATLATFTDPLSVSRYGPLLVTMLNLSFATAILRQYYGLLYAVAGALLVTHLGLTVSVGFLARAWCIPCLLGFGYCLLVVQKPWAVGLGLVLSALFYPPALLINGGITIVWIAQQAWRHSKLPLAWWPAAVGGVVALGVAYAQSWFIQSHPGLGRMFNAEILQTWPEFRNDAGRVNFRLPLEVSSWKYYKDYLYESLQLGRGLWFAGSVLVAFAAAALYGRQKTSNLVGWLTAWAVISAALYQLAKWLMPLLFLPDRFISYPWRALGPLLLVVAVGAVVQRWPRWWTGVACGAILLAYGAYRQSPQDVYLVRGEFDQKLYETIAALPDTVMIAGPPRIMSQVPLFSRRSVLVTHEAAHALYFEHFYDYVTPRFTDQIAAYAAPADSLDQVLAFADKYSVDYFVVHPKSMREGEALAFRPHNERFKELTADQELDDFALLAVPDSLRQVLRKDNYFMLATRDLRQFNAQRLNTPKPPE